MTPEEILALYDDVYAERYDRHFLLTPNHGFKQKMQIELFTLRMLTRTAESWLDVACGTGFFLKHGAGRAGLERVGLDLSPSMLAKAKQAVADGVFREGNFLEEHPELEGRFDVVSSMWGAYGLQQDLDDVARLVSNLVRWAKPGGTVFLPIFLPERFVALQGEDRLMGGVSLDEPDGTAWTYLEPDGKCHTRVLAPPAQVMKALFEPHFEGVSIEPYPETPGVPMAALIARGRHRIDSAPT